MSTKLPKEMAHLIHVPPNTTFHSELISVPDETYLFFAIILTVNWMFGSSFNFVCMCIFFVNPHLRTSTNILIFTLNICDFLLCFVDSSVCAISAWHKGWFWGPRFCVMEGFLYYFLLLTSIYIITSISFHRYLVICGHSWVSGCLGKNVYSYCVACFCLGFSWAVLPMFGWSQYRLELAGITCGPVWSTKVLPKIIYLNMGLFIGLVIPFIVIIFSYISIMIKIKKTMRCERSVRIEKNILLTCALIIFSFLLCWSPTFIVYLHAKFMHQRLPPTILALPPVIGKMQGLLNPIVYVSTNKQMKQAACKWCQLHRHPLR